MKHPIVHPYVPDRLQYVDFLPFWENDSGACRICQKSYTASILRAWDEELAIIGARLILDKYNGRELTGVKQNKKSATYFEKRNPKMGEIKLVSSIQENLLLLRSAEEGHPCFVYFRDVKFNLTVEPAITPTFPSEVKVVFLESGEEISLCETGLH